MKLKDILDKCDFKFLSKGAYTNVYKSPKFSYVIKVTIFAKNNPSPELPSLFFFFVEKFLFSYQNPFLKTRYVCMTYLV